MARVLSALTVAACFLVSSPLALAAETEEEPAPDPVWVISYASFLLFAGVTIFLCVFFSRRRETALGLQEQKAAGELRNARAKQRRKEEQYARIHDQKKK